MAQNRHTIQCKKGSIKINEYKNETPSDYTTTRTNSLIFEL